LRNIKFKEGLSHRTLTTEGEYFLDRLDNENRDNNLSFPNDTANPDTENLQPRQTPSIQPHPRINYPPATHKSSQTITPSRATIESKEYQWRESIASNKGNEWASDKLISVIEDNNEDDTHTTLMASDFPPEPNNLYVPETFKDAFDQT
jgi:hypothetical protein